MKTKKINFDFSGYATKNNLKCSDGRTIQKDAFKDNDGQKVPLVWQHFHDDPANVLGHAVLENREDGVYAYCVFNDTDAGKTAKQLVQHGDIDSLSIFANKLIEKGKTVIHGIIREVSLVLARANPGALIDNPVLQHSHGSETEVQDEAVIFTGEKLSAGGTKDFIDHASSAGDDKTLKDVFDTLSEEQKTVVYAMLAHALEDGSDESEGSTKKIQHSDKGGKTMKVNAFDKKDEDQKVKSLTHAQFQEILVDAQKCGSFREAFLAHTQTYGIENIDYLFPDAKTVTPTPEMIMRRNEWVGGVIAGTHHTPFSRIKSTAADITADDARAKGYVKGSLKKEEVIALLKRITTPTTIYKKQKLDRDDIIDITDLDVVAWLKAEMRMMLDEELARAILVGDGRDAEDDDKISETNIRPIYKDDDLYAHHVTIAADKDIEEVMDDIVRARKNYKGTGNPALYTDAKTLTDMLLIKDTTGRRIFPTVAELASCLRVSKIVEVEVMEDLTRTVTIDDVETIVQLKGIIVNLSDYTVGADRGGVISMFDDFDIDYNQYKYLLETRCSGALVRPKSALVIEQIIEED